MKDVNTADFLAIVSKYKANHKHMAYGQLWGFVAGLIQALYETTREALVAGHLCRAQAGFECMAEAFAGTQELLLKDSLFRYLISSDADMLAKLAADVTVIAITTKYLADKAGAISTGNSDGSASGLLAALDNLQNTRIRLFVDSVDFQCQCQCLGIYRGRGLYAKI